LAAAPCRKLCYDLLLVFRRSHIRLHMRMGAPFLLSSSVRLVLAAVLVLGAAQNLLAQEGRRDHPSCDDLLPGATHTVTRVIDGETVALDDGSQLRLVGALAPRAIDVGAESGAWPLEGLPPASTAL
jgi:hypothetical protein